MAPLPKVAATGWAKPDSSDVFIDDILGDIFAYIVGFCFFQTDIAVQTPAEPI